jgi:uncharacterized protein DUF4388
MAMSLSGTFDAPDFAEVLALLDRRSCTGRLSIRAGSMHATIRLEDGCAVGVEVSGAIWRDAGRDWRASLGEAFLQVLRAGRGSFEFQPADPVETRSDHRVKLPEAAAAAHERLALWREVDPVIPSMGAIPQLAEGMLPESMSIDQQQWRVIVAIDGRRTVAGVARRLDMDQLGLAQILKPLVEDGAIALVGPESWPKPIASKSSEATVDAAAPDSASEALTNPDGADEQPAASDNVDANDIEGGPAPRRSTIVIPAYRTRTGPPKLPAGAAPLA